MDLAALLALLGVSTAAEAANAITTFNNLLSTLMTLSGQQSATRAVEFFQKLMRAAGAEGADALARVEAMNIALTRVPELEAEIERFRAEAEDRQAAELMRVATEDGRLTPSSRETADGFYKENGLKALSAFLKVLPRAAVRPPPRQPKPTREGGAEDHLQEVELDEADLIVAKAVGKSPEQMRESKRLWSQSANERGVAALPDGHINKLNGDLIKSRTAAGR